MTVTDEPAFTLTDLARGQLTGCGLTLSELYRLVKYPVQSSPTGIPGETRISGYGLTAVICGTQIRAVEIDGADSENWEDWARERALFGDGKVDEADALVREQLLARSRSRRRQIVRPVTRTWPEKELSRLTRALRVGEKPLPAPSPASSPQPAPKPAPVPPTQRLTQTRVSAPPPAPAAAPEPQNVMELIHPALRAEITRQVAGDLSRIVVLSATKVQILPPATEDDDDEE
jgi:hypothetical protein